MAEKVGSVYIEIQAKMGSLEKDLKALEERLQNTDKKGKEVSSSLTNMGKLIGGSLITGAVIGLGTAALKASAQMEQQRVAFTTMLGSADKANKLLQDMTKFAAATPFQLNDIIDAGKSLTAFGISSEKIIPTLTKLGDISSALNIPIKELSDLYGKAKVQGTLYAEDLNQLAGRGIPIFTELAKVMGVNADKVKKLGSEGKITFNKLEQAVTNMTKEGSQFGGLMAAQSQTLAGQWSNFGDNLDRIAVTIGDKLAPAAKSALGFLNVMLESDTSEYQRKMQGLIEQQEKYIKAQAQGSKDASYLRGQVLLTEESLFIINGKTYGIQIKQNATASERLAIYKQIAGMSKEEAQIMGLIAGGEEIRSKLAASDLDVFNKKGVLTKEQIKNQLTANREATRGTSSAKDGVAAWKKMADEAKKFSEEIGKKADETDDPVLKVQREIDAINQGYQKNKEYKQKGLEDTSQYNLNVINLTEARIKKEEELEKAKFDKIVGYYTSIANVATQFSGQLAQLSQMSASNETAEIENRSQTQIDALDAEYQRQVEAVNNSTATEAERNAQLKALDEQLARDKKAITDKAEKEKRKIAREAAKTQKELAIFDTMITTPIAALNAFNALAEIPVVGPALGIAAAAAATGLGLAKLKLIQEQPLPALAEGGIVPSVPGGNQFTIGEAGSAEAVIPLNDATLSRLAGMINGAGGNNGQLIQVTVNLDGTVIYSDLYKATKDGRATISQRAVVA